MQQSWHILNTILDSVTALQADRYHSLDSPEIKESAKSFEKSLQPCIQELSESSIRLASLIEDSLEELDRAEAIRRSKARIAHANTAKIWEQITILTGLSIKIKQLGNEHQKIATYQSEIACEQIFNTLIKKHFQDKHKRIKSKIGWSDKAAFNAAIKPQISDTYSDRLNKIISRELNYLFKNLQLIDFRFLFYCYLLFDRPHREKYLQQSRQSLSEIDRAIHNPDYIENVALSEFSASFNHIFDKWRGFGDIYYEGVLNLRKKVTKSSASRIQKVFADRIKLANNVIDEIIAFYSNLLEKLNRYCKETPEHRLAEKSWIEQQKEILLKMQADIQSMTKDSI